MIPLPGQSILPAGTFVVTEDLVTMLTKIPGTFTPNDKPLAFPLREGPWFFLPNGSCLNVRELPDDGSTYGKEYGSRLICIHRGDAGPAFDRDRAIIHQHLD